MHERALVTSTASSLLDRVGDSIVTSVTLAISPETDPDVVTEAWRSATESTTLAGTELNPITRSHVLSCLDCGEEYPGDKLSKCPVCAGNGLVVVPAPEVELEEWTLAEMGAG